MKYFEYTPDLAYTMTQKAIFLTAFLLWIYPKNLMKYFEYTPDLAYTMTRKAIFLTAFLPCPGLDLSHCLSPLSSLSNDVMEVP